MAHAVITRMVAAIKPQPSLPILVGGFAKRYRPRHARQSRPEAAM